MFYLVFELRYVWYLESSSAAFIRLVCIGVMLSVAALWIFWPLRVLVIAFGFIGLVFPPAYDRHLYAVLDAPFVAATLLVLAAFVGVTEIRRRLWR